MTRNVQIDSPCTTDRLSTQHAVRALRIVSLLNTHFFRFRVLCFSSFFLNLRLLRRIQPFSLPIGAMFQGPIQIRPSIEKTLNTTNHLKYLHDSEEEVLKTACRITGVTPTSSHKSLYT